MLVVLCILEMGVMPEIAQAIEEMDWRFGYHCSFIVYTYNTVCRSRLITVSYFPKFVSHSTAIALFLPVNEPASNFIAMQFWATVVW